MNIKEQIFVIVRMFLITYIYFRGFLGGLLFYQLNRKAYNKRKAGQSIKELILYSRFKEEIPKILLILYYFILFIHIFAVVVCILINIVQQYLSIGDFLPRFIFYVDGFWIVFLQLLFWQKDGGTAYSRWIVKKRGMKK